ncbi:MAG: Gfo/Idh/MocA family protein [Planctomycetota bacterium]
MTKDRRDADGGSSRRDFLRMASGAALGSLALQAGVYAAGDDVIRIGMIGAGGRCTGAAANAMNVDKGVRLVAMCDIFMDRVKARRRHLKKKYKDQVDVPDEHCFAGFDAYKKVIEQVDAVCIANAAKFHPFHTMAAIQAGKHVFVEKPHGIDPAGVKMLRAACKLAEEKGLSVVSGLQSRFHPGYQATIEKIHEGAIGDIVAIEENFLRGPYGLYRRKPGLTEVEYQASNQYHFTWLSGDDVPQSLIHNLDRSLWALKGEMPVKCHGMGGRSGSFGEIFGNVFDHHGVVYEFASGARIYAFCRTVRGCYNENSSKIYGTKGWANLLGRRIHGENPWHDTGRHRSPYDLEHDALFKAIRAGKPVNSGYHMADSTLVTVMGQISCYTGKEVTWKQVLASDFHYPPKPEACRRDMEPPVKPGPDGQYPVRKPGTTKLL